jgi:hypothetical protein
MEPHRFDVTPQVLTRLPSRRTVLRALAAAGTGWGVGTLPESAEARKKRRKKRRRTPQETGPLCARNGEACARASKKCRERYCLRAPFTISAIWQAESNHDTWLLVPPQDETTGPGPQIDYDCNQSNSPCQTQYPFACVSNDEFGPGDEITTIYERLPGTYAYWLALDPAPAGELTVVLKDRDGRVVRRWSSPAIASRLEGSWHVFDVDGETGRVTSVDAPLGPFPELHTNICPE